MKRFILAALFFSLCAQAETITVGSKNFTEAYILGEWIAQTLSVEPGVTVERKFGIGGTGIVYEALLNHKIDLYVEYTGTLREAVLKDPALHTREQLQHALDAQGLALGPSLGFSNTYALAVRRDFAEHENLHTISDLARIAVRTRLAFSYEFMSRADGFPALAQAYSFPKELPGLLRMDHALVYDAMARGQVDVIEVYSTDAKLDGPDLVLLEDDRAFFPKYEAVILTSKDFRQSHPGAWRRLFQLENVIDEAAMRRLNAQVDLQKKTFRQAVASFRKTEATDEDTILIQIARRTQEHLILVGISLFFAILLGIPLGILASRRRALGQGILLFSSLVQTIPSLALLCFLIPVFGIGVKPALVALILYGLLPVVINTFDGLKNIDPELMESAASLPLGPWRKLWSIELPLASPNILTGIKTSAIIGIGTATIAALIGAGGYGVPIVTGLALNDNAMILTGAIPSALLAVCTHFLFEGLRTLVIPKGLR